MKLPKDLPGGWKFKNTFAPKPLESGQVWRKTGPIDAIKIVRVMMPGHQEHDGGANGVSVRSTIIGKAGVNWARKTWFWMGTESQILERFKEHGYAPAF
ncbi:hypothetical protein [Teredinibacter purpureus]|uniref:hypothetical protein n=1 Tax=Teredinibacter purpureus TaxID=2731756 RepID=UPI0005F7E897|nr:hypothetical protein [Teredinibacter purpureus]